jgi:uncharacterized protein (TIGR01244 family)
MRLLLPLLFALFTAPALAQTPVHAPTALTRPGFQGAIADAGPAYLSGQPTEAALRALKAEGVTTVINLRTQREMDNRQQVPFDEAALLRELGMTYVHIPLGGPDTPYSPAAVEQLDAALRAAGDGKVLLHCTVAWRVSHLWAAWLVKHRGVTLDEATRQMSTVNLNGYSDGRPTPLSLFLAEPQQSVAPAH